jgi:tetratricopeptide (TPR) repeat protein
VYPQTIGKVQQALPCAKGREVSAGAIDAQHQRCRALDFAPFSRSIYAMITSTLRSAGGTFLATLVFLGSPLRSYAEHKENWTEIRSTHFTVISNAGEYEGRRIALQFEEVRSVFEQHYPKLKVDSGKPTIVFALKNEDSLKLLLPSYGQNSKAMHLAGFYYPSYDKNFAVIRADVGGTGPLSFRSLYHEYTHAFFRYNFRGLPLWLDEGLAELYGNTSIEGKTASVGLANKYQLQYLQKTEFLPLDQLVSIDRSSPLYNTNDHAGVFYSESWALVHYLRYSEDVKQQDLINKFLATLHETDDPIEAAKQTFGDLNKLSERLQAYTRQLSYPYERVALPAKLSANEFTARPLSQGEGTLALADFLLRKGNLPEGLERLHQVAELDPATPGYHSEMGHYHLLKGDYANAEKELQTAIAANPKEMSARMDMAWVYLRRDGYTKETVPKIRTELETVLTVAPEFPPAFAFLSNAYIQEPDKDTDKALKNALRATKLEPGNLGYFIDLGRALLAARRIPEAGKVAEAARKVATTPADRKMSTAFAKQVEYRASHPQDTSEAKASNPNVPGVETATAEAPAKIMHAEGQVTELLCGHPPEVILTLTTGSDSLLLHVADIAKISIQDGAKVSDAAQSPCTKWKDRYVKVDYRTLASGMAKGEIQYLSLD